MQELDFNTGALTLSPAEQLPAVAAVLQLLTEVSRIGADQAVIELAVTPPTAVFFREKNEIGRMVFEASSCAAIEARLMILAAQWKNDPLRPSPQVIIPNPAGGATAFSVAQRRKAGSTSREIVLQLSNITEPALEGVEFSKFLRSSITSALAATGGVIVVDHNPNTTDVDARAVMLAMRPDALYLPAPSTSAGLRELVELAVSRLIVVGQTGSEPAQLIYQAFGQASDNLLKDRFIDLLHLAYVHRRAKRTCPSCLKPTKIVQSMIDQLPAVLKPEVDTYLFGRGCESCGHSAYLGWIGLDSLINVDDELRRLLKTSAPIEMFIREAYRAGTRALLEDGVEKIFKNLTSFEAALSVAPTLPAGYAEAAEYFKRKPPQSSGKNSVLIVEDDPDQRGILEMVFKSAGYEVTGAANGTHALELLQNSIPDVIICDLMMPGMNGDDLVREIRCSPKLKDISVMVLTAVTSSDTEFKLLEQGADDYCDKNVKRKVLLKRVENLLVRKNRNPVAHLVS